MRLFKIKSEEDLKKIQARNIEPIKITKSETCDEWDIEVEEDVDIDAIIKPEVISPVPEKKIKEKTSESDKKKKKKKK